MASSRLDSSQPEGERRKSLIVFVHGLGGGIRTWGKFKTLIDADPELRNRFDVVFYRYPTSLIRLPFMKPSLSLELVVDALDTRIALETEGRDYAAIFFVCHSMGGLLGRDYAIKAHRGEAGRRISAMLLYATPNQGSEVARLPNFLSFGHHQLKQLFRESDLIRRINDDWRDLGLDDVVLVNFVVAAQDSVVTEASARGFWGSNGHVYVLANDDHRSVVKPRTKGDESFRVFEQFVGDAVRFHSTEPWARTIRIGFADGVEADLVSCQLAIEPLLDTRIPAEVCWPEDTLGHLETVRILSQEVEAYRDPSSSFHGADPDSLADYAISLKRQVTRNQEFLEDIGRRVRLLVQGMTGYWGYFDNVIARSLANFLTLCHCSLLRENLYYLRHTTLMERYFPKAFEDWFQVSSNELYRSIFSIDEEICWAKVRSISGRRLDAPQSFWGPRTDLVANARWTKGEAISWTWVDKYLIPQNELLLLKSRSSDSFRYDEEVEIIKVLDARGNEIG